ncbi:hypothetical protein NQD34_008136 [Periophthalmus magnuspinnatus]|nr:hypothetical protein NQD34_008136 [Periophthalmus magnuspinnatus]
MRSTTEFDLGLGSFSLLDEIVSGQEWAKFLNPVSASVQQGPSQETMDRTLTSYQGEKSGIKSMLNERHVGTNTNILGKSREASDRDIAMTQVSPEPPSHISMDITAQTQLEPMDHGQSQSDMQVTASVDQPQRQHSTKTEVNTMDKSSLRDRLSLSRKRQHQSYEIIQAKFQRVAINGNDIVDDNHVMHNTDGRLMSFFPSPTKPSLPVPRGVLKSTISCDSNYSVGTVVKKRRMDVTRHVHFSEEIIAIDPPELGPDMFESEEEEEEQREEEEDEEDDSFLEEDSEELSEPTFFGPVRPEQVAPSRRSALPAWIRALKRKKKKERKKPR